MIRRRDLSEIGVVNKPHGHAGEMSVTLSCDIDPSDIRFLIMDVDGIFVPFPITGSRPRGSEAWLVSFEGITSDSDAAAYTGSRLYALTDTLRDLAGDDAGFDHDSIGADSLIGFSVVADGSALGVITDIDSSTINALFVVRTSGGGTCLIPVADEFITGMDEQEHILYMSLPTGLVDL